MAAVTRPWGLISPWTPCGATADGRFMAGEDDEGSADDTRCSPLVAIAEVIRSWFSPCNDSSKWRRSVSPLTDTSLYNKYAKCAIEKVVLAVGFLSFVMCVKSFTQRPWWNETESCLGTECPVLWAVLVTMLYAKNFVLNVVGVVANAALVYGACSEVVDFIYTWLMWRSITATLNVVTIAILLAFNLFVQHDLRSIACQEFIFLVTNVLLWVAVFAYYEQIRDEEPGGGGAATPDNNDDGEAGIRATADDSVSFTGGEMTSNDEGFLVDVDPSGPVTAGLSTSSIMMVANSQHRQQYMPRVPGAAEVTFSQTGISLMGPRR